MDTVEEVRKSLQTFHWSNYVVFIIFLIGCLGIGFHFRPRKPTLVQNEEDETLEYLFGGRQLKVFPISLSLIVSLFSGIGILGMSTEFYLFGYHFAYTLVGILVNGLVMHYLMIPVFHEMKFLSLYEYLERRFNRSVRLFGSIMFFINSFIKIPIYTYVPVVALNQVAGVGIHETTILISLVCICYTCVGGIRAVVWTDVVQAIIILGSLIVVIVKATVTIGGFDVVIERNLNSTRIEAPILSADPTIRVSLWAGVIGGSFMYMSLNGIDQSMMQRYASLPSIRKARQALWIYSIGLLIVIAFSMIVGLLTYAFYYDCDPLSTGLIKKRDQILPVFVMNILGHYPVFSGFFAAGILSASLSSISSCLNSMSAVVLEDFVKPWNMHLSDKATSVILRGSIIVIGLLTTALVFVVEKLALIVVLIISFQAITFGPLLGVFFIGLGMPWLNAISTFFGAVIACLITGVVVIKNQFDMVSGTLSYASKPLSTEGCSYSFNATVSLVQVDSARAFYHVAYLYHSMLGTILTIIVANILGLIFGYQSAHRVDRRLLSPPLRRFFYRNDQSGTPMKAIKKRSEETIYVPETTTPIFLINN